MYNVDGTQNEWGTITKFVLEETSTGGHRHLVRFLVTSLGKEKIILGLPWLKRINPTIDFVKGTLSINPTHIRLTLSETLCSKWFPNEDKFTGRPKPRELKTTSKEGPNDEQIPVKSNQVEGIEAREDPTNNLVEPPMPDIRKTSFEPLDPVKPDTDSESNMDEDLLLAYIRGEDPETFLGATLEVHANGLKIGSPLTNEHKEPEENTRHGPTIGRIQQLSSGHCFCMTRNTWIQKKVNPAMALAQRQHEKETPKTFEEMLPEAYRDYAYVFEKKASECFPVARPWDHAIDLKPDFTPKDFKLYPLNP